MTAKQWFNWHSLTGVWTGLLLFVICWSGTFATLSYELDWLTNPAIRASSSQTPQLSLAEAYQIVSEARPQDRVAFASAPLAPGFNYDIVIETQAGQWRHLYVDPVSGVIAGDSSYLNIQRFFRDFHRVLFGAVNRTLASYLVFLLAIPLLISVISALYLYRCWWQKFFTLNWSRQRRANVASLHKLAGVWSLWFSLVIALTSVWYLYEAFRVDAIDGKVSLVGQGSYAVQPLPPLSGATTEPLPLTELVARAQQARPDLQITSLWFDSGYLQVHGQAGHLLVRDRANKLYLDPYTGEVVHNQNASDLSLYWRWSDTADPLHFGDFAGLTSKLIWFVFGLILSFMALSGSYMYVKRQQSKRQPLAYRRTLILAVAGTVLMLLASIWAGYQAALSYGVAGQLPALPVATTLFLGAWLVLTVAIIAYWCFKLFSVIGYERRSF